MRVSDSTVMNEIINRLPPGWKPGVSPYVDYLYSLFVGGISARSNTRRFNLLYGDADRLARSLDLEEVLDRFEADLQLYVAEWTNRRVFVHAGAVGWRGKAILFPGRSFSGKTTLVAEMVRAGATYYSDEYAVLDAAGNVHPYPKPLAIRENGSQKQRKYHVAQIGGKAGAKSLPVGLVVVSRYKPQAQCRLRRLSAGQGALALFANTVCARTRPERAMDALKQVVIAAPVLKGVRGEASSLVNHLLNWEPNAK